MSCAEVSVASFYRGSHVLYKWQTFQTCVSKYKQWNLAWSTWFSV